MTQVGLPDDVPLNYTLTISGIYTTVEKGKVTLIDGQSPHPCVTSQALGSKVLVKKGQGLHVLSRLLGWHFKHVLFSLVACMRSTCD